MNLHHMTAAEIGRGLRDRKFTSIEATKHFLERIDRSGKLPAGAFPGRPDIRFDALVVVTFTPGKARRAARA